MRVRYTKEMMQDAVDKCSSWAGVARFFGLKDFTGSQHHLKKRAQVLGVNASHFTGQAHNRNKTWRVASASMYLFNGSRIHTNDLRRYLIRDGLKREVCEICGISEWLGEKAVLELDHIDSNPSNNTR